MSPMSLTTLLTGQNLMFVVFGAIALASAFTMLLASNPLRAALCLVLNLFCVAGLYLSLDAAFLATVQVIVYAGAIMVLFLFVIMLLNLGVADRSPDPLKAQGIIAMLSGIGLAVFLGLAISKGVGGVALPDVSAFEGSVQGVGRELYRSDRPWLFPFEVTSILLLVAVVGSVTLARKEGNTDR
ncbi:MAG: NADH-quinone oxidoreductase subunit J [Armatimonadota bacterium]